ncbi:hypothetical protein Tdes44962_MAKER10369 [Teratosphaeria destructans]|uniref:Uncharacterized protein n=1 Tax=Teratosphaeria destructans TaxID=418781 RepID=A0A9W7VYS7_9PEZI|nr:hypothetical protein Tdes44962_MAKER10369 [Teratosphaeria destructans]
MGEMSMGASPGGRVGVRRASAGKGGGGPGGGGVGGVTTAVAYGLVMYDASEVVDGIGSRRPDLPPLRRLPLVSLPSLGDQSGDRYVLPFFRRWASAAEGDEDDPVPPLRGLIEVMGGWLWNRQKTWYSEARSLAAMTRHSGPDSPFWQ